MATERCANCSGRVDIGDRFCRDCGKSLAPGAAMEGAGAGKKPRSKASMMTSQVMRVLFAAFALYAVFYEIPGNQTATDEPEVVDEVAVDSAAPDLPYPEVERITLTEAKTQFEAGTAVLVDTRDLDEYVPAHIPGAIQMSADDVPGRYQELLGRGSILTYCT